MKNRMLTYSYNGETISVDLENGFTVTAFAKWNNEEKLYYAKFYINRQDVNKLDLIAEDIKINADIKTLRVTVAQYITEKFNEGFYDYYMDNCNYEIQCFDIGNNQMEIKNKQKGENK